MKKNIIRISFVFVILLCVLIVFILFHNKDSVDSNLMHNIRTESVSETFTESVVPISKSDRKFVTVIENTGEQMLLEDTNGEVYRIYGQYSYSIGEQLFVEFSEKELSKDNIWEIEPDILYKNDNQTDMVTGLN